MKKVLVLGLGAQGSAAAKLLDKDPGVSEIVCADYDIKAVNGLVDQLTKAKGVQVDANNIDSIVAAAEGCDLILNALALTFTKNVLDAALIVKADYQDYNGTDKLFRQWDETEESKKYTAPDLTDTTLEWWKSYMMMFKVYAPKFEEIGKLAIFGTGSAPGTICAASKLAVRYLDTCDTIYNFVWEGAYAKRFQPFWWSPITAMYDMSDPAVCLEGGKIVETEPFSRPITRKYDYMDRVVTFREHCHDEPFQYAFNADTHFKGVKNAYFKYAGAGMDFASQLFPAGLLSHEEEEFQGQKIIPFDYIMSHIPPAPHFKEDIQEFVDEGLALDSGCMVIEAYGKKDGEDKLIEVHIDAPGFVESFERSGITGEMYLTGQSGYLFSKLFINGDLEGMSGLISSDMLNDDQVDKFFEYAAELDITAEVKIKDPSEVCEK